MKRFIHYLIEAKQDDINRYSKLFHSSWYNSSKPGEDSVYDNTFKESIRFGIDNGTNHDEKLFIAKAALNGEVVPYNDEDKPTVRNWINTFNRNKQNLPKEKQTLSAFGSLGELQNHLKPFVQKNTDDIRVNTKYLEPFENRKLGKISTSKGDFDVYHIKDSTTEDYQNLKNYLKPLDNDKCTWCIRNDTHGDIHLKEYSRKHGFLMLTQNKKPVYGHGYGDRGIVDLKNTVQDSNTEGEFGHKIGALLVRKDPKMGEFYINNAKMLKGEKVPEEHIDELVSEKNLHENPQDARFLLNYPYLSDKHAKNLLSGERSSTIINRLITCNDAKISNSFAEHILKHGQDKTINLFAKYSKIPLDYELHKKLAEHPNPEIRHSYAAGDMHPDVRIHKTLLDNSRNGDGVYFSYVVKKKLHPDIKIHQMLVNNNDSEVRRRYAERSDIHPDIEIHKALVNDKVESVREAYAGSSSIHPDISIHRKLVNDPSHKVRAAYVRNSFIHPDIEIHKAIVNDKNFSIRAIYALGKNSHSDIHPDISIHEKIVNDPIFDVRQFYATNPNIHPDISIHEKLANDDVLIRRTYAGNPGMHRDIKIHEKLANDSSPEVRNRYAANPAIHSDIKIHEKLVNDDNNSVRASYASNPKIHSDIRIHEKLVNDDNKRVRLFYASNPNIFRVSRIHEKLAKDPDNDVRVAYFSNKKVRQGL